VLPLALKRFRRKYKSLALDIRTLHSRDIISAIALREADVGVVYGTHPHPAVEEQLLATGHLVCLMPGAARPGGAKSATAKGRTTLPLTDLAGQPVIRIHHQDPIGFVLNDLAARLGVEFGAGVTVQTYQAALSLAEHGFGPAIVDQFTVAGRRFEGLSALRIEPLVPIQLNAIRPRLETQMAAAGHFIACLQHVAARIVAGDDPAGP
jgi:DNA-binding transcriptional LysR family regulator